jgi:SAM-dependent methyltransferase
VDRRDLRSGNAADYNDYPYNCKLLDRFDAMKDLYVRGLRKGVESLLSGRDIAAAAFLDVGCANGEYLWAAKEIGFGTVAGVEIDRVATETARRFGEVVGSLGSLSVRQFDAIQMKNMISNVVDFSSMVQSCVGMLNPNGVMIVDVPNQGSLTSIVRKCLSRIGMRYTYGFIRPPYLVNGFNRRSLGVLLQRSGLEAIRITTAGVGSDLVPTGATFVGRMASTFGAGSILISESTRRG